MSNLTVVQKDGFNVVELNYNNNNVDFVLGAEYFNATQMGAPYNKEVRSWLRSNDVVDYLYIVADKLGKNRERTKCTNGEILTVQEFRALSLDAKTELLKQNEHWGLVKSKKGGKIQGTWIHKKIALRFAQWCDPEFAVWVDDRIEELMSFGKVILNQTEAAEFEKFKEQRNKPQLPAKPVDEIDLQFRILDWVNLCVNNARFNIEVPMLNSKNKVRRLDFIKNNGRNVIAYELKLNKITLNDVTEAIANREYFELLSNYYDRPITFIFLSPLGITDNATTLLRTMPNIKFQTVHELCYQYYIKGINNKWKNNVVNLTNNMNTNRFGCLFNYGNAIAKVA